MYTMLLIMHQFACGEKKKLVEYQKVSKYYDQDCRWMWSKIGVATLILRVQNWLHLKRELKE